MDEKKRQPCTVYSRVVGYIMPLQNWNPGKTSEYEDRKTFDSYNKEKITNL